MGHRDAVMFGHHVGCGRTPNGIRHFIAFDLSAMKRPNWNPEQAVLQVTVAGLWEGPVAVQLFDAEFAMYDTYQAAVDVSGARAVLHLTLPSRALDDLRQAGRGFYSLTLAFDDPAASLDMTVKPVLQVQFAAQSHVAPARGPVIVLPTFPATPHRLEDWQERLVRATW